MGVMVAAKHGWLDGASRSSDPPAESVRHPSGRRYPVPGRRRIDAAWRPGPTAKKPFLRDPKLPACHAAVRPRHRGRTPNRCRKEAKAPARQQPATEKVTILKRGQDLTPATDHTEADRDVELCSGRRLGPEPEILPKKTSLMGPNPGLYANSGTVISPSPSSLPFPAFFLAKKAGVDMVAAELRFLLRLDPRQ